VAFVPGSDYLWSVGDYINRGPKSLETLRFLKSLGTSFTGVLGNHDLHFLAVASGANRGGKIKTLRPLLDAHDCAELFDWMRQQPMAHLQQLASPSGQYQYLMVHAGIVPGWTFSEALGYAREVEAALQGPDFMQFLEQMYGDQPDTWDRSLTGMERLRVISNILTRIRFCTAQGKLNLQVKSGLGTAPPDYQPWFAFQQLAADCKILFGHWATINGNTGRDDIIGLDTGCVWGRCMTVLRLDD